MAGESDAQSEIRELLSLYCNLLDRGEHAAWVDLFTSAGRFEVYGEIFEGPDGLLEMATTAPGGLHLTGDALIEVEGDTASVKQSFLFVDQETRDLRIGFYDDALVHERDRWLFGVRRSTFLTYKGPSERPTSRRALDDVHSTLASFDLLLARGDVDSWSALFLDDAVLNVGGVSYVSADERARFARSAPARRRVTSLPVLTGNLQSGRVQVSSSFLSWSAADGSVEGGSQVDELVYRKGSWRFASRLIEVDQPA